MSDNSSNNKRIARNTVLLYCRSLFLMLINLYASRITLHVLGVQDFGIYQLVGGVVSMFSMLSSTLAQASQRFITYALGSEDELKTRDVFSTCITLHFILGVIVVVLLEVLGVWFIKNGLNIPSDRLNVAAWVMQFSIATFFVDIISVPYNSLIISHERMNAFAYISVIEGLLKLGLVFFLLVADWDKLFFYAFFQFLAASVVRIVYTFYCKRNFIESIRPSFRINRPLFREMFAFSGWNLVGSGSMVLRNQGIDILLNLFYNVAVNAAKGICNQVQNTIQQFVGNFTTSITPQLTKAVAQKDYVRVRSLVFHGGKFAFFMMMCIAVPFIVCTRELLQLWLGDVPEYAVEMVKLVFIYLLSDTLSRFLINSLLAFGDIRNFQLLGGGTKLFALPLAYVILRMGGSPLTGIWVNIGLDFVCLCIRLYFMYKRFNFDVRNYLINAVFRCWLVFAIAMVIPLFFYTKVSSNLILAGFVSLFSAGFLIWTIGLDKSERKFLVIQTHNLLFKND